IPRMHIRRHSEQTEAVKSASHAEALASSEVARWLRRWLGVAVGVVALITVVTAVAEAMPASHYAWVPVATGVMVAAWAAELLAVPWPGLALVGAVVLPNFWLTLIGHVGANYLFLLLLVVWVELVGSGVERAAALVLSLATLVLGMAIDAADGQVIWASWISYLVVVLMAWSMGLVLRRQDRLVGELRLSRAEGERRAGQGAVLEERERLARELHDSVTQSLYAISLHAEAACRALAEGDAGPAVSSLVDI